MMRRASGTSWEHGVAKRIADVVDLAQFRQRRGAPDQSPAVKASAAPAFALGAFFPFMAPVAYYWMPVWVPVLTEGWPVPKLGADDAK